MASDELESQEPLLPAFTSQSIRGSNSCAGGASALPSAVPHPDLGPSARESASSASGREALRPLPHLSSFLIVESSAAIVGAGSHPIKPRSLSSATKTLGNLIVSIVGAGVLGLPYAFKVSGWAFSLVALAAMALVSLHGMLLLTRTRKLLEERAARHAQAPAYSGKQSGKGGPEGGAAEGAQETKAPEGQVQAPVENALPAKLSCQGTVQGPGQTAARDVSAEIVVAPGDEGEALLQDKQQGQGTPPLAGESLLGITNYGDLAYHAAGEKGKILAEVLLCTTQISFCAGYLIFIGTNIASVASAHFPSITPRAAILGAAFAEIFLSWLRSLSKLAPFSIFADVIYLCAFSVIIFCGLGNLKTVPSLSPFTTLSEAPTALGAAIYAFEGAGSTLVLEANMKEPARFPLVLSVGVAGIATTYSLVGFLGYAAFGEETKQIVTLNLPGGWVASTVMLGLAVSLYFTFPVMMHPVYQVYEAPLCRVGLVHKHILPFTFRRRFIFRSLRGLLVCLVAFIAAQVPQFSTFTSLVGSSTCCLIAFILPAFLHFKVGYNRLSVFELALDVGLMVLGLGFAVWGTYLSLCHILT